MKNINCPPWMGISFKGDTFGTLKCPEMALDCPQMS